MATDIIRVEGMSCEHCVKAVTQAVGVLPGVTEATVDLEAGTVAVSYDPAQSSLDNIESAIDEQGYEVIH